MDKSLERPVIASISFFCVVYKQIFAPLFHFAKTNVVLVDEVWCVPQTREHESKTQTHPLWYCALPQLLLPVYVLRWKTRPKGIRLAIRDVVLLEARASGNKSMSNSGLKEFLQSMLDTVRSLEFRLAHWHLIKNVRNVHVAQLEE